MNNKSKQMRAKVRDLKRQMKANNFLKHEFFEMICTRRSVSEDLPGNHIAFFEKEVSETLLGLFEMPKEEYEKYYREYKAQQNVTEPTKAGEN